MSRDPSRLRDLSDASRATGSISLKGQIRIKKAERLVEQLVGEYFRGELPREASFILTVTRVKLSKDLRYGDVFVHVLTASSLIAGEASSCNSPISGEKMLLQVLEEHRSRIQSFVFKEMRSKFVPKLSFKFDHGWEQGQKVTEILRNLKKDEEFS